MSTTPRAPALVAGALSSVLVAPEALAAPEAVDLAAALPALLADGARWLFAGAIVLAMFSLGARLLRSLEEARQRHDDDPPTDVDDEVPMRPDTLVVLLLVSSAWATAAAAGGV